MKKMLMIGIYGLVILGASAGGTWFLRQKDLEAQQAEADKVDPMPDSIADLAAPVDVTKPLDEPKTAAEEKELPVAVRPEEMSVEEIVRYGLGLKKREAAIHEREEALRRTETQHRLVLADIDGEQKEMEGLLAQARDQRAAAEKLLEQARAEKLSNDELLKQIEEKKATLAAEQKQAAVNGTATEGATVVDTEANLKELVTWIGGMSPEAAASAVKSLTNSGRLEDAVNVLAKLEERNVAAVMEKLQEMDEKLGQELMTQVLERKTPVKL